MFALFEEFETDAHLAVNVRLVRYARARDETMTELIFSGEEDEGSLTVKGSLDEVLRVLRNVHQT